MIALVRKLFWSALFAVFTLGFVTLFDHGFSTPAQFVADAQGEVNDFVGLWKPLPKKPDTSDKTE